MSTTGYRLTVFPQARRAIGRKRLRWHVALEYTNGHVILTSQGYAQRSNAYRQADILSVAFGLPLVERGA